MEYSRQPNIILIVADDMGYSDCSPFGGEIETPALQELADQGVRFRNFHTSSLCAPTRAMLLSGCDNHQAGLGNMPPLHATNQYMQPGYEGYLNQRVTTIPEILKSAGYHTYMAGKWHLGEQNHLRPHARGFEKSFSFLGGGCSHFSDIRALSAFEEPHTKYSEDGHAVEELPSDFYSSDYFTDKLMGYIADQRDDRPFFGYLAFTAPHDPLQVPDGWRDACSNAYDDGYDEIRGRRLERMKALGLVPDQLTGNEGSGRFRKWGELSGAERRVAARKMEIYAAMIKNLDWNVGRLLKMLKETGRYDDTIVVFLSDNGANPKEPYFYPPNTKSSIEREYDNAIENLGRKGSFISIGGAWAEVANTPLSYFKLTTYEGGTQTPLIISGRPVRKRGIVTRELLHVTDLLPTLLDFARVGYRATAEDPCPLYGVSLKPFLQEETFQPVRNPFDALCFEIVECKAVLKGGWKLIFMAPPYGSGESWRLYNLDEDIKEEIDLSDRYPEKVDEMKAEWQAYARAVGYIMSNGESMVRKIGADAFYRFDPKYRMPSDTVVAAAARVRHSIRRSAR